jgi:hypothetical protein
LSEWTATTDRNRIDLSVKRTFYETPGDSLAGTATRRFDSAGLRGMTPYPVEKSLIRGDPFFHAIILTYKRVYDASGGYSTQNVPKERRTSICGFVFTPEDLRDLI